MKHVMRSIACVAILMSPAVHAEEAIVPPADFRAYADGYTLYFERDGQPFGSETFADDGSVRWRFRTGECVDGLVASRGAQLCFKFFDPSGEPPQCWRVLRDDEGLMVRLLTSDATGLTLRIVRRDREPLLCGGPSEDT